MRRSSLLMLLFITVLTAVAAYVAWPGSRTILGRRAEVVRGLDLQGGLQVLLEAAPAEGQTVTAQSMDDAREIVENRVNGLGVSEPVVQRQGADRIVVELPGVRDPQQAIDTFQGTGLLEFVDVGDTPVSPGQEIQTSLGGTAPTDSPAAVATVGVDGTAPVITDATGVATTQTPSTPAPEATPAAEPTAAAPPEAAGPVYRTVMTGAEIDQASAGIDPQTQQPVVQFKLTSEGARVFGEFTQANIGRQLAIVLDKRVVSAPTIQSAITGGEGVITGVDRAEANSLAIQLRYGSLPVPLEVVSSNTVGATLGRESVDRSITAGAIGVLAVALFMLLYYRLPGLVSVVALAIYSALVFALFKLVPVTLTLAGIAGFVLSIGMAVDANVLIFARMKEELRRGRGLVPAVDAGFRNAWPSIRDSNVSTLITCAILYWFGSTFGASIIRGFAITLAIGVLVSMFTAIVVTRSLLRLVVSMPTVRDIRLWGIARDEAGSMAPSRTAGGTALDGTRAR